MAAQKNGSAATPPTKMAAVEWTMKERGPDVMPLAIKDHLKKRYSIDISAAVASDYKKKLKKKMQAAATPQPAKAVLEPPASPPAPRTAARVNKAARSARKVEMAKRSAAATPAATKFNRPPGDSVLLEDVLTAKALLDRMGADALRALINGLAT